jgi:REP element-mobilizing transposase RayT
MPSSPRIALPGTVVLITSRVEEGLPFVPAAFMELLLKSALGRAQHLRPLKICHFLFMGNHVHLLAVVENPDDVPGFMDRFKTESSHSINRLLGRRKRTVWCKGYDCVPILTVKDVRKKIAYIYTNPQTANLVESIEAYPGFSSWHLFQHGKATFDAPWINRSSIFKIGGKALRSEEAQNIALTLRQSSTMTHTFVLHPDAWMDVFKIFSSIERDQENTLILKLIRRFESFIATSRKGRGLNCLGRQVLCSQPIDKPFWPKKFSKRMLCICSDPSLRKKFISRIKALREQAMAVLESWRRGEIFISYPLGLFPPSFPKRGNLLPNAIF